MWGVAWGDQVIERFMTPSSMEAVGVPSANATVESCGQSSHTLYDTLIAPLVPFVFKVATPCAFV